MAETPTPQSTDDTTDLTPNDVAGLFDRDAREVSRDDPTPIEQLLGTPTRVSALATLATAPSEQLPMTVAEISERAAAVTPGSWAKHEDVLLESGVVELANEVGGTRRYQLNTDHPVAQAWSMTATLAQWGRTPQLVDEQFLGAPDAELDVETAEEIDAAAADGASIREDVLEDVDDVEDLQPGDVVDEESDPE